MTAETRSQLENGLTELPERQRAVVVLRDVHALTSDEVCSLLGLSATNQRVLLHRGRSRLRGLEVHYTSGQPRDGHMKDEQPPGLTVNCQEIVELVTDYLEGKLDPQMTAEVEAHLELCDGCDTYVEQMRATIRTLGTVHVATLSESAQAELVRAFRDLRGPAAAP